MVIKDLTYKNNKFLYYFRGYLRLLLPKAYFRAKLQKELARLKDYDQAYILDRVNYYNKLAGPTALPKETKTLADFRYIHKMKNYFFDAYEYTRYFPLSKRFSFLFGDIIEVAPIPAIVKSRPLSDDNANSVVLKLDKIRHFTFVNDKKSFTEKKNMLVGRNKVFPNQVERVEFLRKFFGHPSCNIGLVNENTEYPQWLVPRMSMKEQLDYKFVLCLEGNDVATNLKWVMSSNSLAVLNLPKYETWFMEGRLIPNYHYVQIEEDYSDLEEKLQYYIAHPEEAQRIIDNANHYVAQFLDKRQEDLISLLVLDKYFRQTLSPDLIGL